MNKPSYLLFKKCTKCGEIKHISRYSKKKGRKYGVNSYCKECNREYHKQYREDNKEYIKGYQKEYYKNNKDKIKKKQKEYYKNNKDDVLEYQKKYRKNNPDKIFNNDSKRRFKENTQGNGISQEQWYECFEFFNWECAYSGIQLTKDSRNLDHIVALDNGGEHEIWNCVPIFDKYNFQKKTSDMLEWYLQQEYFDIDRLTKIYEWRIYAYEKWGRNK